MTSDPSFGFSYLIDLLWPLGLEANCCYLAEDGSDWGLSREQLNDFCDECDLYINLSNINWIPELMRCRRRVLVDTDPVFTQIGGHGIGGPFANYHALFTFGENVHRSGCTMPTGEATWIPTRQPVVLDLWPVEEGEAAAPLTSVMNWSAYGDRIHEGRLFGQKDREFRPFFSLPQKTGRSMEMAVAAPREVRDHLVDGGWKLVDPLDVTRNPFTYQRYIQGSAAEFCVAKHAYVTTRSGWFSERTTGYLASGRPAVVQDTGFSDFIPAGLGLLVYGTPAEAEAAIAYLDRDYADHCGAAREIVEEFFDSDRVLTELLERSV